MAFQDIFGNTTWKTVNADKKIESLQKGSATDKYDQILDVLRENKKFYLQNGQTQDEWTDRVLFFSFQREIQNDGTYLERKIKLENNDNYITEDSDNIILQNEPVFNILYLTSKISSWFNSETRCELATKTLVNAVNEKGISFYSTQTQTEPDGNLSGPSDSEVSSLSWLPSDYVTLHNTLAGLTYSKYTYYLKLCNIHLRYNDPVKIFTEIDVENTTAIANLTTSQLNDLLTFIRDTYSGSPDDSVYKGNAEAACEMLEFDMAQ